MVKQFYLTLADTTIQGQSRLGSNGNEKVLRILQSSIRWFIAISGTLVGGVLLL